MVWGGVSGELDENESFIGEFDNKDIVEKIADEYRKNDYIKLIEHTGISVSDAIALSKKGITLKVITDKKTKKVVLKLVGENISNEKLKEILKNQNVKYLSNSKLNKLIGKGLFIKEGERFASTHLTDALAGEKGFKSAISYAKQKKFGDISTLADVTTGKLGKGLKVIKKGVPIVATGLTCYVDAKDNLYNPRTGKWEFSAESIGDTVSDIGTDVIAEGGAALIGTTIGAAIGGPIGAGIGFAAGLMISGFANRKFGEPPKSLVDHTKNWVKKKTHSIGKVIANLFW